MPEACVDEAVVGDALVSCVQQARGLHPPRAISPSDVFAARSWSRYLTSSPQEVGPVTNEQDVAESFVFLVRMHQNLFPREFGRFRNVAIFDFFVAREVKNCDEEFKRRNF